MKIKDHPFKAGKMDKEEVKKQKELEKLQREAEKKEMNEAKMEYNLEKGRIFLERLQLNWIKWNITCVALGFTAYKFYYERVEKGENLVAYYITGREIGIFLIVLGFVTLLLATLQHKKNTENLKLRYEKIQYSLSLRLSYVVLVFSLIIFLLVIFRS